LSIYRLAVLSCVHVRNRGELPATITQASAHTERHGDLAFNDKVELPANGDGHLRFFMTSPTADEGLLPGERVDITIHHDGRQMQFAARWLGPSPDAWEVLVS
jgi:hypothetical protein